MAKRSKAAGAQRRPARIKLPKRAISRGFEPAPVREASAKALDETPPRFPRPTFPLL